MNSLLIDIIFVVFLLLMIFYGYKKGFITRIYDVLTTILVLFLTSVLTGPISNIWQVYKYSSEDLIATMVGSALNFMVVFIILFIVLFILKKVIGIFIKPLLKGLMDKFTLTSFADKLLGIAVSVIEVIIFSYISLVFILIPFYDGGARMIEDTVLSKYVIELVPSVTRNVIDMTDSFKNANSDSSSYQLNTLVSLLLMSDEYHILDDEQIQTILKNNVVNELESNKISLSDEKKTQFEDMLSLTGYNKEEIASLLKNINVSGE